jgi:arylformamidase
VAVHDISVTLRPGLPVYPGDPPFRREQVRRIRDGDASNLSMLHMSAHHGTHLDAPLHMIDGAAGIDEVDPGVLVGPALVVRIAHTERITSRELEGVDWGGVERVLFRTDNSGKLEASEEFTRDFIAMDGDAGRFLADLALKLVGVDYLSVDGAGADGFPAHMALLGSGVAILEGIDLSGVEPGWYDLFCGALRVEGGDGAPARAFLVDREDIGE